MLWWLRSSVLPGRQPEYAWISLTPDLNPTHLHPWWVQNVAFRVRPGIIQWVLQPRASSITHCFISDVNLVKLMPLGQFGSLLGGGLCPNHNSWFCASVLALISGLWWTLTCFLNAVWQKTVNLLAFPRNQAQVCVKAWLIWTEVLH